MINGNEILFPHNIGGNRLATREYGINNINGGFTPIANYNIIRNSFMGGNVIQLGLVKELGFYICPHYSNMKMIVGFYIHDPEMITALGKQLLQEHYPTYKITYVKVKSGIKASASASGVIEAFTDPVAVVCKNPVKR
jgi:hypothetical protein